MSIPGCTELDIAVELEDVETGAKFILKHIRPHWNLGDVVCKTFTEGLTNHLLGCRLHDDPHSNDMVLVRVYGAGTEAFTDRILEMSCIYLLSKSGRSRPLYARFKNGIAYGYMPGEHVTIGTVRDPHIYCAIAREVAILRRIHLSPHVQDLPADFQEKLSRPTVVLFDRMRTYIQLAAAHQPWKVDPEIPDDRVLSSEVDLLEKELTVLGSPVIFCHNDLLLNNIIYNKEEDCCRLIDFEFSSFCYQAMEIGDHFCEWAGVEDIDYRRYPDKETQLEWLTHYLTEYRRQQDADVCRPSHEDLHAFYVHVNKFALAAHMKLGLWGLAQGNMNSGAFSYTGFGKIRIMEYFKRKEELFNLSL